MLGCCGNDGGVIALTWDYVGGDWNPAEYQNALSWLAARPTSDFPGLDSIARPKIKSYFRDYTGAIVQQGDPVISTFAPPSISLHYGAGWTAVTPTTAGGRVFVWRFRYGFGSREFCRVDTEYFKTVRAGNTAGDFFSGAVLNCAHFGVSLPVDVLPGPLPSGVGVKSFTGTWNVRCLSEFVTQADRVMPDFSSNLENRPVPACCGLS